MIEGSGSGSVHLTNGSRRPKKHKDPKDPSIREYLYKVLKNLQDRHVLYGIWYAQVLCCNGCRAALSWRTSAISLWTRYTRETSTRISSSPSSRTSSRSDPTSRSPHLCERLSFCGLKLSLRIGLACLVYGVGSFKDFWFVLEEIAVSR